MNLITKLITRVEEYYETNKKPCKTYATEERAEAAAVSAEAKIAAYYDDSPENIEYVVFYVPAMGRWTVAFNVRNLLNTNGGYAGFTSDLGYFTY